MYTPETIRVGAAKFDGYAIAMSALVAPTEFLILDGSRAPEDRLAVIKGIAIASLHAVVTMREAKRGPCDSSDTELFHRIACEYYQSGQAERLAEPVRGFRPNPLLTESFQNKLINSRIHRVSARDLLAGLPPHSMYDVAIDEDSKLARSSG